jgi:hypothetical protein
VARRFLSVSGFCDRASVSFDGFRNSVFVNELPLAAASDYSARLRFHASQDASYITGVEINVEGGMGQI